MEALIFLLELLFSLEHGRQIIYQGDTEMTVTIQNLTINLDGGVILLGGLLILIIVWLVRKYR